MVAVRFLHLLGAALWLGGLATLLLAVLAGIRSLDRESFRLFIRTAGRAFAAVSAVAWLDLAVTGALLGRSHLHSSDALTGTLFGRTLTAKICLAAVALVAAALHTWTGRMAGRRPVAVSRALAGISFAATLGVFWLSATLAEM